MLGTVLVFLFQYSDCFLLTFLLNDTCSVSGAGVAQRTLG